MSKLLGSADTKNDLQDIINDYYFSTNYIITEDNRIYNTKQDIYNDRVKVVYKHNRWRLETA